MKHTLLTLTIVTLFCRPAGAGTEYSAKELKQVQPAPCPEWYGDNEWNVSLWGTYAFTGTDYSPNLDLVDLVVSTTEGETVHGSFDRYIGNDHAWGGGGDIKYFFHRYFGIGVEGFVLTAKKNAFDIDLRPLDEVFFHERFNHERAIGSALGTFTFRYPIPCSRFAPYAWAGAGAIFGGGESDQLITNNIGDNGAAAAQTVPFVNARTRHFEGDTRLTGQFGYGLEVRFTRHIGWTNDFSWNVVDGPKNNFGMVRSGLTFAF
jgi:hypothetical protein